MKYKAIIYDLDGTLIDTFKMNFMPLQELLKEELGVIKTYEELLQYATYPGIQTIAELGFPNIGESYQKWVSKVNAYPGGANAFDGVLQVLDTYQKENIIQAVVSSKKRAQYYIDIEEKGWGHYFSVSILEEDTRQHKPDPAPLLACLEQLQLCAHEVIYIGDGYSDYLSCKAAGIDFGFAKWGSIETRPMAYAQLFETPVDMLRLLQS